MEEEERDGGGERDEGEWERRMVEGEGWKGVRRLIERGMEGGERGGGGTEG